MISTIRNFRLLVIQLPMLLLLLEIQKKIKKIYYMLILFYFISSYFRILFLKRLKK